MARTVGIGNQDFETVREREYFYIDKTHFIKEWWESGDSVTLITRPRRFGKTLNISMMEKFFSVKYADRGGLFEGLSIWKEKEYREIQGTYPVIMLSFASIKETDFISARRKICHLLTDEYNKRALLLGDVKAMNTYMNKVTVEMFSYFDTGNKPSGEEPERFYHGFVLGLMVELADKYAVMSNRESGFGRYDVVLEPRREMELDAVIIEFKVQDTDERELSDTVQEALRQIEEKDYQAGLVAKGIPQERIRKFGFAFCGKKVLIG